MEVPQIIQVMNGHFLVGGFKPSEKHEFVSWDFLFPTEWKNKIHVPNHKPVLVLKQAW